MNKFAIEFRWAIIFSVMMLLWMVFEKNMGWHDAHIDKQAIYTNFFGVFAIVTYFLAINQKKKIYYKGNMNWTQGFLSGLLLSFFIAIISPIVQYVTFTYITPDFFKNFIVYAVERKIYDAAAAEAYFSMNSYIIQGIAGSMSMGVITSALVALFVKSKPTNANK